MGGYVVKVGKKVGILLTEDTRLLRLKDVGVKTINWDTILREMRI